MIFTYKTQPVGRNASSFGWIKLDDKGVLVESSTQTYPSEADAENAIRNLASTSDIVEVRKINNVNKDSNDNVNLVKPKQKDENFGMNRVDQGIIKSDPKDLPKDEVPHANVAKMADIAGDVEVEKKHSK